MTRSAGRAGLLAGLGARPVVCDVFDAAALTRALACFASQVVFHQLTDLPDDAGDIAALGDRASWTYSPRPRRRLVQRRRCVYLGEITTQGDGARR